MKNLCVELPAHAQAWMRGGDDTSKLPDGRWRDGFSGRKSFLKNGTLEIAELEPGEALYLELVC